MIALADIAGADGGRMAYASAPALLDELRSVPAIGSWAVLDSIWTPEDGWHWDGCRPREWFHMRADAEAAARSRSEPTCIGRVVAANGGWMIGDVHEVEKETTA